MTLANTFFYTFRTNKYVDEIEFVLGKKLFVIQKPAQDFEALRIEFEKSGADSICGIGMLNRGVSRFEPKAFNKSGKGKALKGLQLGEVVLATPKDPAFEVKEGMTTGPCNYVAFRIAVGLSNKSYFCHLNSKDIAILQALAV